MEINNGAEISQFTNLKYLYIYGSTINDSSFLLELKNLECFAYLVLKLIISQKCLRRCPLNRRKRLTLGTIRSLTVGEEGLEDISPLADYSNIQFLGLWDNWIEDISSLSNLKKLEELNLDGNEPLKSLEPLYELKQLKHICTPDHYELTEEDIQHFGDGGSGFFY